MTNNDPTEVLALIQPTVDDRAAQAVNLVLRDETVELTTKFMAIVKSKLKLLDSAYQNMEIIQETLFEPDRYATLSNTELIKLFKALADVQNTLGVSIEDQKITFNQINAQLNNVMSADKTIVNLPRASRAKLKDTIMNLLKNTVIDDHSDE